MVAAVAITNLDDTAADLRRLMSKEREGEVVRRLCALALVLEGHSRTAAAAQSGMDRQTLCDWVHRYNEGGVAAIIMPGVNTEAMNEHLNETNCHVANSAHALLVCDGAGWHQPGERLIVPDNIALLRLPPYAAELNTMEKISAVSLPILDVYSAGRAVKLPCVVV